MYPTRRDAAALFAEALLAPSGRKFPAMHALNGSQEWALKVRASSSSAPQQAFGSVIRLGHRGSQPRPPHTQAQLDAWPNAHDPCMPRAAAAWRIAGSARLLGSRRLGWLCCCTHFPPPVFVAFVLLLVVRNARRRRMRRRLTAASKKDPIASRSRQLGIIRLGAAAGHQAPDRPRGAGRGRGAGRRSQLVANLPYEKFARIVCVGD